jgi:hypothetical protein
MDHNNEDLNNVWAALVSVATHGGASIMFIGTGVGDSVSYCARAFSEIALNRATKPVWLLDLGFFSENQFSHFSKIGANITGPFDMTFGQKPFWRLNPNNNSNVQELLVGARVGNSNLFISRFRREKMQAGQNVQITSTPDYWKALRQNLEVVVVDAPPLEQSRAGLALVPDMDAVVIVIDSNNTDAVDGIELRDEIVARGGNCIGAIVVNNSNIKTNAQF